MIGGLVRRPRRRMSCAAVVVLVVLLAGGRAAWTETVGPTVDLVGQTGVLRLFSAAGPVTLPHPFGQSLGTNDRMCVTCHVPTDGMSITPATVQARFDASGGFDPIFRANDGSNSPDADVSTLEARRAAYSMLLSRGVIRIELPVPAGAEFTVEAVDDPYGFATRERLSLFRRPLPAANLAFLTAVMWDGRETSGAGLFSDLAHQADGATLGHAQAARSLTADQQAAIVDLQTTLFAAPVLDRDAAVLFEAGASGGPEALAAQRTAAPGVGFKLFDAWRNLPPSSDPVTEARRLVARGQDLFNTRVLGVEGFTCAGCHNRPNVGNDAFGLFFNTGVAIGARRSADLPLYSLRCPMVSGVIRTTDPGRALVTGRCNDISAFKVPSLRALASRAPFFHDGSAPTLRDVVLFYDRIFGARLEPAEIDALIAFLRAL